MQTYEKITVTTHIYNEVSEAFDFDQKYSELISADETCEIFKFGPYTRKYWFDDKSEFYNFTHTQLQFDENWVEPERE